MAAPTDADIAYMMAHAHDDRRPNYIAANSICIGLAAIAVVLRLLSRFLAQIKLGFDDYTICISLLFTMGYVAALFVTVHYGMGRHVIFLTEVKAFAITALVAETLYNFSIMTTKVSILLLFHRLFPLPWFKRTILALGVFIIAYSVPQMFGTIFQCVPIHSKWTPDVSPKCINYVAMIIACGVINIVTDFIMLALPIPVLWSLQVSQHRKWVLTFMFLIGGMVCIISIVRLFYAQHVDTVDPTWDFVWPSTISGLECCSAIIAACIPTYRPLLNRIRHGVASENTVPRPTKPSTNDSGGHRGLSIPLRRLLHSKPRSVSQPSSCANEPLTYEQIGQGNDFDARIEATPYHVWNQPTGSKQDILVTHTVASHAS